MENIRFEGFDHVDARVRSLAAVKPFYDAVMSALGLKLAVNGADQSGFPVREYYEADVSGLHRHFFGIHQAANASPNVNRIAFAVASEDDVIRVADVARAAGARAVEGPEHAYQYEPYFAVFFEDPEGNRLEVCYRAGSATFPADEAEQLP